jgi:hypothetical protein
VTKELKGRPMILPRSLPSIAAAVRFISLIKPAVVSVTNPIGAKS